MGTVRVTSIINPLQPLDAKNRIVKELPFKPGRKLLDYVRGIELLAGPEFSIKAAVNGKPIAENDIASTLIEEGDSIVYCSRFKGGGGGGSNKNIGAMVAMVAVMVVAVALQQYWAVQWGTASYSFAGAGVATTMTATATSTALATTAAMAVAIGGSMLVNSMFPAARTKGPSSTGLGDTGFETSNNYTWGDAKNAVENGVTLPVLYGTHRVTPPLIAKHGTSIDGDDVLHLLYAVSEGPIDSISDVYINKNPVELYDDVDVYTRLGVNNQTPITGFGDVYSDLPIGKALTWDYDDPAAEAGDWAEGQTYGNAAQGIIVTLTAPRGLWYANNAGGLSYSTVYIDLQYRKQGDEEWNDMTVANASVTPFDQAKIYESGDTVSYGDSVYRCVGDMSFPSPHYTVVRTETEVTVNYNTESALPRETIRSWQVVDHYYNADIWKDDGEVTSVPSNNERFHPSLYYSQGDRVAHDGRWYVCIDDYSCPLPTQDGYWHKYPEKIELAGNETDPMTWTFRVDNLEVGRYETRARFRSMPELKNSRYGNAITLSTITEIQYDDLEYPNLALCGLKALATDQLSGGLPTVSMLAQRLWVNVWNGEAWVPRSATNPAWAAYDALVNKRYGADAIDVENIIYEDFLEWAEYCEAKGFTCNVYFDSGMNVQRAMDTFGTLGHAIVIPRGARIGVIINRAAEPVQMFNTANMVAGSFKRSWVETKERANYVEVSFWNKDIDYEMEIVPVKSDSFDEALDEERKAQVTLIGCTSKRQAMEHGAFLIKANEELTQIVSFEADIDAIACGVGDVILVSHPVPLWGEGGRCSWYSSGTRALTLAQEITMEAGQKYQVLLRNNDTDELVFVDLVSVAEDTTTDTVTLKAGNYTPVSERKDKTYTVDEIGAKITSDTIYSVGKVNNITKPFRVTSITRSQEQRRKITALEYSDRMYTNSITDATKAYTFLDSDRLRAAVSGLTAVETWERQNDGTVRSAVNLKWTGAAMRWQVYKKNTAGTWVLVGETLSSKFKHIVEGGTGTAEYAVCTGYSPESGQTVTLSILGKAAPPSDIEYFAAVQVGDKINLRWDHIPDDDLMGYEIRVGQAWETGEPILNREPVTEKVFTPPFDGTYTFWIKAIDTSGISSTNAVSASVNASVDSLKNVIFDLDELTKSTPADGTMDDMVYRESEEDIILLDSAVDTDLSDMTAQDIELANLAADSDMTGSYTSVVYDLGTQFVTTLRMSFAADTEIRDAVNTDIADRTNTTFPQDTNDSITSSTKCTQWCRTSDDNVEWSGWNRVDSAITINARYYQLKWIPVLDVGRAYFAFTSMRHTIDVPDKTTRLSNVSVSSSGLTISYSDYGLYFFSEVGIGVTILGSSPLTYTIVKDGLDGFTLALFDSGGTQVAGSVDLIFHGF